MLNFTVGPVMSDEKVRAIGAEQVPYFRTPEFSKIMLENEVLMKKFAKAADDARVVFITGSGTASMEAKCMYLDLKSALKNGERGQTPFTPAVGILRQINARLKEIDVAGGVEAETKKIAELAQDFREKIKGLPFEIVSESMSNAVTPLHPLNVSAYDVFTKLKDEYGIWICPSGGEMKETIFRVGHSGALTKEDNTTLVNAFKDLQKRGLL